MIPDAPRWSPRVLAGAALAGPMVAMAVIGGLWEVILAVAACALAFAFRWLPRLHGAGAASLPPLVALVVIVVAVPPTVVEGILAAVAGLGFLLWLGSDGRTMASVTDRLGGLALPGFAAFLALATSVAARGAPPSFGIAVAGAILLGVLLASAALIGRPALSSGAPPAS